MVIISINTDGAAFDDNPEEELARVLHDLADRFKNSHIRTDNRPYSIKDVNGNTCGQVEINSD